MNILDILNLRIKKILIDFFKNQNLNTANNFSNFSVELPKNEKNADISSNVAMIYSKFAFMKSLELAEILRIELLKIDFVKSIDIAGPGFLNFWFVDNTWEKQIRLILEKKENYGKINLGKNKNINIEFVSANPTGPLHAAHARGAILGDVLSNLLSWVGYNVIREYYINDAGVQVDVLAKSTHIRYKEIIEEKKYEIPSGLYPGDYLITIANEIFKKYDKKFLDDSKENLEFIKNFTIDSILKLIKNDLTKLEIKMDVFTSEKRLIDSGIVEKNIKDLSKKNLIYLGKLEKPKGHLSEEWKPREQRLFKSKKFGDDVDRPIEKEDGSWTYFASDLAYHMDKLNRTSGQLINIWGTDHSGYVKRMIAAVEAISGLHNQLDIKLCQIVNLLDNGNQIKMSKRSGNYISLNEVINAVGSDAIRFIMLTRKNDQVLDFDFSKVTEKSHNNPVFYVQYAYARCSSVLRDNSFDLLNANFSNLNTIQEIRTIKHLVFWPNLIKSVIKFHEPHRLAFYLIELAGFFHSMWNSGKDNPDYRFIVKNENITRDRLALVKSVSIVLKLGLKLMNVKAPKEM